MSESRKKVLVIVAKAPHGTFYVQEALDVMFIMTAYEIDLSVLFTGDGVLALKSNQNTKAIGTKGFMASIGALTDWDIKEVFVDADAMRARDLSQDMLVSIGNDEDTDEALYPRPLEHDEVNALLERNEATLSF